MKYVLPLALLLAFACVQADTGTAPVEADDQAEETPAECSTK